jgi:uncharacterized protein YbjT (DUF2867 family)
MAETTGQGRPDMTILVTNANGKVGSQVVSALVAAGRDVRVGARSPDKAAASFPGATVVPFDYADPASVEKALAAVTAVFTSAPYELLPGAELDLIAAAQRLGVPRIVKLSALGVEADPGNPHSVVEAALRASALSWTVVRPTFFMQNYGTMAAPGIRDQGAIYEPAGDGKSSFVDTRDIAAVVVKALTEKGHEGKAYPLTGPEALDRSEVASIIAQAAGKPVRYVPVDDAALRQAMAGAPPVLVELMSTLFGYVRAGQTAGVTTTVADVLGRSPTDFSTFARDHADAWR